MSKELATTKTAEFPALAADPKALAELIRDNLGGANLSPFDLEKISIPSAGSLFWTIPGLEGETQEKELLGIILFVQDARAYWKQTFAESGGGTPPDCTSEDAITGHGDPGGPCQECPFAQFGSDGGDGQACKLVKRLLWLMPNSNLPVVLNITAGSLKRKDPNGIKKYLMRLTSNGINRAAVVTGATLEKDTSTKGIVYSKVVFAMKGRLDATSAEAAIAYGKALAPVFKKVAADDFITPEQTY